MRGVSTLERLAGLCDGALQSFTQKPQSPPHREMTVAGGTASAQDSPISATAWTDEWPLHAAATHPHRPRTCSSPHAPPAPRSCSMRALRFSRMSSRTCHARRSWRAVVHASAGFARLSRSPFRRFSHFCRSVPREPGKCAPSSRGRAASPSARRQPIVPSNYIVRAIRAITIRR